MAFYRPLYQHNDLPEDEDFPFGACCFVFEHESFPCFLCLEDFGGEHEGSTKEFHLRRGFSFGDEVHELFVEVSIESEGCANEFFLGCWNFLWHDINIL